MALPEILPRRLGRALVLVLAVTIVWPASGVSAAVPAADLTVAEQWVLQQSVAGLPADLGERFTAEADRVLRVGFLEQLLTDTVPDQKVSARGIRIAHAVVRDNVDLRNREFPHETRLEHSVFNGDVDISFGHFAKVLSLEGSEFKGRAKASYAVVGAINTIDAKFMGEAVFDSMRVDNAARFDKARYAGFASFTSMRVDGQLVMNDAVFADTTKLYSFSNIKVQDDALFVGAMFAGAVLFRGMKVGSQADFTGATFSSTAIFTNMSAGDDIRFGDAPFAGDVDLDGLNYLRISAGSASLGPLAVIQKANFSAAAYENLEAFYRRQGQVDLANTVYIERRRRERAEIFRDTARAAILSPDRWVRWAWNVFLEGFVHYGRSPAWALVWSCILVALAWGVVWHRKSTVVPRDPTKCAADLGAYNGFLYSLELFVPGLNLHMGDDWRPNRAIRGLDALMVVQKFMGWVVVPIGLAAVAGLIR